MVKLLTYCATPSRIKNLKELQKSFVESEGHIPIHPFDCLPYEYWEGGHLGRQAALEACFSLVKRTSQLYLFGISDGTLGEARTAIDSNIPVLLHHMLSFDPDWRKEYEKNAPKHGTFLDDLLKSYNII